MGTLYILDCGGLEKWIHSQSDDRAKAVASRWIRMFWSRYCATLPPGSMAAAFARDESDVRLWRYGVDSAGVYSTTAAKIDGWALEANDYIADRYTALSRARRGK